MVLILCIIVIVKFGVLVTCLYEKILLWAGWGEHGASVGFLLSLHWGDPGMNPGSREKLFLLCLLKTKPTTKDNPTQSNPFTHLKKTNLIVWRFNLKNNFFDNIWYCLGNTAFTLAFENFTIKESKYNRMRTNLAKVLMTDCSLVCVWWPVNVAEGPACASRPFPAQPPGAPWRCTCPLCVAAALRSAPQTQC